MSKFFNAMNTQRESKGLDTMLKGSGSNYLPEGVHDVTIVGVDSSQVSIDRLTVTYADEAGKQFKDMMYLMSKDGEMSVSARMLLAGALPNKDALEAFLNEGSSGNLEAFNMLTGMKMRITLGWGKGFKVNLIADPVAGTKKFQAVDSEDGTPQSDEFDTVEEARNAATAKGLQRAYLRIKKTEATHGDANVSTFLSAVAERQKAKSGNGGLVGGDFIAGSKTPSFA